MRQSPSKNSERHGGCPSLDHVDVVFCGLDRRSLAIATAHWLGFPATAAEVVLHLSVQLFLGLLGTPVSACTLSAVSSTPTTTTTAAPRTGTAPTLASPASHWTARAVAPSTGYVTIDAFTCSLILQVSVRGKRAVSPGWNGDALGKRSAWHNGRVEGVALASGRNDGEPNRLAMGIGTVKLPDSLPSIVI